MIKIKQTNRGRISVKDNPAFSVSVTKTSTVVGVKTEDRKPVHIKVETGAGTGGSTLPEYSGDYEVTPRTSTDVVLNTSGKTMTENVTVKTVPYYEVSNTSGGMSIYIPDGESLEIN